MMTVTRIATSGVRCFVLMCARGLGSVPARLMANNAREAAVIPATALPKPLFRIAKMMMTLFAPQACFAIVPHGLGSEANDAIRSDPQPATAAYEQNT